MSSPYQILQQTRAGQKRASSAFPENEDRVLVREFTPEETGNTEPAILLAVADGVSRCPDGGAIADWIVEKKLRKEALFLQPGMALGEQLRARLHAFHDEFLETFRNDVIMLESGCTLSVALLWGSLGVALWSGDSPVYHLESRPHGFFPRDLIVPDADPYTGALIDCFSGVTPFALGHRDIQMKRGDIVIAATDGIVYSGSELAASLALQGFTRGWLEFVCQTSYETPRSDDVAIAAVSWRSHG